MSEVAAAVPDWAPKMDTIEPASLHSRGRPIVLPNSKNFSSGVTTAAPLPEPVLPVLPELPVDADAVPADAPPTARAIPSAVMHRALGTRWRSQLGRRIALLGLTAYRLPIGFVVPSLRSTAQREAYGQVPQCLCPEQHGQRAQHQDQVQALGRRAFLHREGG